MLSGDKPANETCIHKAAVARTLPGSMSVVSKPMSTLTKLACLANTLFEGGAGLLFQLGGLQLVKLPFAGEALALPARFAVQVAGTGQLALALLTLVTFLKGEMTLPVSAACVLFHALAGLICGYYYSLGLKGAFEPAVVHAVRRPGLRGSGVWLCACVCVCFCSCLIVGMACVLGQIMTVLFLPSMMSRLKGKAADAKQK